MYRDPSAGGSVTSRALVVLNLHRCPAYGSIRVGLYPNPRTAALKVAAKSSQSVGHAALLPSPSMEPIAAWSA